ncbi:hypothetical protein [Pseudomonas kitaguniensis]|uniref:hypothetical protein n=1 Tax=Pseudomonas kitaguniensis TaxID=2607908 RepID=UPI003CFD424C
MHSLVLTALQLLGCMALLFVVKEVIELFIGPIAETWVDLALILTAYLMFFALTPLQHWMQRRSQKRARRRAVRRESTSDRHSSN